MGPLLVVLVATGAGVSVGVGDEAEASDDPCPPGRGTLQQVIEHHGEERTYLLHVPRSFACDGRGPMLVDLHGTATLEPELADELPPLVALAEREGALLVRPRSNGEIRDGAPLYQWDLGPGDLERNSAFVIELARRVAREYSVDPRRAHLSSFSNATNLAAGILARPEAPFEGYALLGGGAWSAPEPAGFGRTIPRVYASTGVRDYMRPHQRELLDRLRRRGFPRDRLWVRTHGGDHGRPTAVHAEIWGFLDRGERPSAGEPTLGWERDPSAPSSEDLAAVVPLPSGELVVGTAAGALYRGGPGRLARAAGDAASDGLAEVCVGPEGVGIAVGGSSLLLTADGGASWTQVAPARAPPTGGAVLQLAGCACADHGRLLAVGPGSAIQSFDGGRAFEAFALGLAPAEHLLASVAVGPTGTVVAVGADAFIGRGELDAALARAANPYDPGFASRYHRVAGGDAGVFWAVGVGGAVLVSEDDGASWADRSVGEGVDLHGVAVRGRRAVAVGDHGRAFLTEDTGRTWTDVSTGLDVSLLDIAFVDSRTIVVGGEAGTLLWRAL